MDCIKFSRSYDKLNSEEFTTIRVDNPLKYQIGSRYRIIHPNGEFIAEIIDIRLSVTLGEVPLDLIKLDSGVSTHEEFYELMSEYYSDLSRTKWSVITLKRI